MTIVHLTEIEIERFLANFPNKTKIVKRAVMEYKQRHYGGVYFSKEEMIDDVKKFKNQIMEEHDKIKDLHNGIEKAKRRPKEIEDNIKDSHEKIKLLKSKLIELDKSLNKEEVVDGEKEQEENKGKEN